MLYEKGRSGNPGGRPRKTQEQIDFERKCREWGTLFALDKLKKAADSGKAMEIIAAVKEILDRGFGKSEQIQYSEVNVTTENTPNSSELVSRGEDLLRGSPEGNRPVVRAIGVDPSK